MGHLTRSRRVMETLGLDNNEMKVSCQTQIAASLAANPTADPLAALGLAKNIELVAGLLGPETATSTTGLSRCDVVADNLKSKDPTSFSEDDWFELGGKFSETQYSHGPNCVSISYLFSSFMTRISGHHHAALARNPAHLRGSPADIVCNAEAAKCGKTMFDKLTPVGELQEWVDGLHPLDELPGWNKLDIGEILKKLGVTFQVYQGEGHPLDPATVMDMYLRKFRANSMKVQVKAVGDASGNVFVLECTQAAERWVDGLLKICGNSDSVQKIKRKYIEPRQDFDIRTVAAELAQYTWTAQQWFFIFCGRDINAKIDGKSKPSPFTYAEVPSTYSTFRGLQFDVMPCLPLVKDLPHVFTSLIADLEKLGRRAPPQLLEASKLVQALVTLGTSRSSWAFVTLHAASTVGKNFPGLKKYFDQQLKGLYADLETKIATGQIDCCDQFCEHGPVVVMASDSTEMVLGLLGLLFSALKKFNAERDTPSGASLREAYQRVERAQNGEHPWSDMTHQSDMASLVGRTDADEEPVGGPLEEPIALGGASSSKAAAASLKISTKERQMLRQAKMTASTFMQNKIMADVTASMREAVQQGSAEKARLIREMPLWHCIDGFQLLCPHAAAYQERIVKLCANRNQQQAANRLAAAAPLSARDRYLQQMNERRQEMANRDQDPVTPHQMGPRSPTAANSGAAGNNSVGIGANVGSGANVNVGNNNVGNNVPGNNPGPAPHAGNNNPAPPAGNSNPVNGGGLAPPAGGNSRTTALPPNLTEWNGITIDLSLVPAEDNGGPLFSFIPTFSDVHNTDPFEEGEAYEHRMAELFDLYCGMIAETQTLSAEARYYYVTKMGDGLDISQMNYLMRCIPFQNEAPVALRHMDLIPGAASLRAAFPEYETTMPELFDPIPPADQTGPVIQEADAGGAVETGGAVEANEGGASVLGEVGSSIHDPCGDNDLFGDPMEVDNDDPGEQLTKDTVDEPTAAVEMAVPATAITGLGRPNLAAMVTGVGRPRAATAAAGATATLLPPEGTTTAATASLLPPEGTTTAAITTLLPPENSAAPAAPATLLPTEEEEEALMITDAGQHLGEGALASEDLQRHFPAGPPFHENTSAAVIGAGGEVGAAPGGNHGGNHDAETEGGAVPGGHHGDVLPGGETNINLVLADDPVAALAAEGERTPGGSMKRPAEEEVPEVPEEHEEVTSPSQRRRLEGQNVPPPPLLVTDFRLSARSAQYIQEGFWGPGNVVRSDNPIQKDVRDDRDPYDSD
eukprot:g12023.t1